MFASTTAPAQSELSELVSIQLEEAKASCEKVKSQLRNKGKVKGISGLNGYGNMGFIQMFSPTTAQLVGAGLIYVGLDLPGAKPFIKTTKRILQRAQRNGEEPHFLVGNGCTLLGGVGTVTGA